MSDSRLEGFYRLAPRERIALLQARGWLAPGEADALRNGRHVLRVAAAERMIENVIGCFGLPLAVAPNFIVNGRETIVPLVVEEPSIVAGLSAAARLTRAVGGFAAAWPRPLLIGQVHIAGVADIEAAIARLEAASERILEAANAVHPRLEARGGGVRRVEFRSLSLGDGSAVIAVHLLVDTVDAMGANLVNTICEALAPELAGLAGGEAVLAILSNLVDEAVATASATIRIGDLAPDAERAAAIRDGIIRANEIARVDPYRAATHNKGIMNGIDPLAIATGNDWRAIEAGVHAWAAADGSYTVVTDWTRDADGNLVGKIRLPLKPGVVGGTLSSNPGARLGLAITGATSARELAELMAAVGLAQNFAALRALTTTGIQRAHMRLHARSVVAAAGVPAAEAAAIERQLVASGEIKEWKARELHENRETETFAGAVSAHGKVILLGEHAVVYGRRALALPLLDAVRAQARPAAKSTIRIPAWNVRTAIAADAAGPAAAVPLILAELGAADETFAIDVDCGLPRGMGLGSSAALAVAVTRALAQAIGVDVDDARVNEIAYRCEELAHGTPSGVDNTLASYGRPMLFRRGETLDLEAVELREQPPIVIAFSSHGGSTLEQVAAVRERHARSRAAYERVFDEIDALAGAGAAALERGDYEELGTMMNINQGLLNALGVSTPELEDMVALARAHGAAGAKLTGAGGGGSIVALCPGVQDAVRQAFAAAGYETLLPGRIG
jgi:hydroxymethylglutaryl-CoA reductase